MGEGELAGIGEGSHTGQGLLSCGCTQRQADSSCTVDACRLSRLLGKIWMLEEELDLGERVVGVAGMREKPKGML